MFFNYDECNTHKAYKKTPKHEIFEKKEDNHYQ